MSAYYHGGFRPRDGLLLPQPHMRDGRPGDGWVYVTTERNLAATYAATCENGWVMQVTPIGPVERDPESILGTSYRCRSARVVKSWRLSAAERDGRARVVRALGVES